MITDMDNFFVEFKIQNIISWRKKLIFVSVEQIPRYFSVSRLNMILGLSLDFVSIRYQTIIA